MPISKYRKKPVVVEAVKLTDENAHVVVGWCDGNLELRGGKIDLFWINTLEGRMLARAGDYIIKGVKGEFYPCRPDIFHATYEAVDNA